MEVVQFVACLTTSTFGCIRGPENKLNLLNYQHCEFLKGINLLYSHFTVYQVISIPSLNTTVYFNFQSCIQNLTCSISQRFGHSFSFKWMGRAGTVRKRSSMYKQHVLLKGWVHIMFKSVLKQQLCAHTNIETGWVHCNHAVHRKIPP